MAYNTTSRTGYTPANRQAAALPASKAAAGTTTASKEALFSTGLFAPKSDKTKSIGSVQLKEAVTLPAGSYINLYTVENGGENKPVFRIQVREGVLKSK